MNQREDRRRTVEELQHVGRAADMTHISEPLASVMSDLTLRACAAGHPPPGFTTGGYDDPNEAPPAPRVPHAER